MTSDLKDWIQVEMWPAAGFVPCDMDQPCGNCDHPMRGHFRETVNFYAIACVCGCQHWHCRHGGVRNR